MARTTTAALFLILLLSSTALADYDYNCNCDDEGTLWSIRNIFDCQRVSDFLIAAAYLSIPIELLYFVSFSNFPFKWVLGEFVAFIVLCGLTHLLNGLIYGGASSSSSSFRLMFYLTVAKVLTALVSCATAITLLPLIPMLLKWKVRELFLRQNVLELDQEVGLMKKQKEASQHVRMLTRKIRTSLDKHTILYTTLVELSKTLDLDNCLVWMPSKTATMLDLTHCLKPNDRRFSIPINDPYVVEIKNSPGVVILNPNSELACVASNGGPVGPAAAIRVPLLQVSDFKGGTPHFINTRYAILVLVLAGRPESRKWTYNEVEIVEVVADQVAVALSHATVLEESQLMQEKLRDQNRALQTARKDAVAASAAKESFQKVMSHGMRRPMHSITGLLSILEPARSEQKLIIGSMMRTGSILSTLINDVMGVPVKPDLEMRLFELRPLMKEVSCLAKCLCMYKGLGFSVDVRSSLPDRVMGDEKRTFQVILHMVGYLLDVYEGKGSVHFRVFSASGDDTDKVFVESVYVKFEVEIRSGGEVSASSVLDVRRPGRDRGLDVSTDSLGFTMYKRLIQRMQGNIKTTSTSQGLPDRMTLVLRFPIPPLRDYPHTANPEPPLPNLFLGLRVLLADDDHTNMTVTNKQLTRLGCQVTAVSSGFDCLSALSHKDNSFRVVLLDLHLSDMDGFEVAVQIRQLMSRSRPVIIALTVSSEERVTSKCLQSGMNGLVRKPVVVQTLADEILRVLNRVGGV